MRKDTAIKILALIMVFWLIVNLALFVLKKITPWMFWLVIIVFAVIAYKGMPFLRAVGKK
jgi:hypothetical protein